MKTRCSFNTTNGPCLTTRHTHWDRAPFICVYNQTTIVSPSTSTLTTITTTITTTTTTVTEQVIRKKTLPPIPPSKIWSYRFIKRFYWRLFLDETRIFYDSDSCLVARTRTHQYTFCFRRQNCSHSPSSAFCTTKYQAQTICYTEKNQSNLLTIDNNEEYRLINEIISQYSDESLLNCEGRQISKYVVRAQWMWINGIRSRSMQWIRNVIILCDFVLDSEDQYHWNVTYGAIPDHLWCDQKANCSGGKGRDHIVLNIICQTNDNRQQICLASRRASEPGPFVCKRRLTDHEGKTIWTTFFHPFVLLESIKNYTILRPIVKRVTSTSTSTTTLRPIVPVYEKSRKKTIETIDMIKNFFPLVFRFNSNLLWRRLLFNSSKFDTFVFILFSSSNLSSTSSLLYEMVSSWKTMSNAKKQRAFINHWKSTWTTISFRCY